MSEYLMQGSSAMMLAGGLFCLLVLAVFILLAASLFKYLSGTGQNIKTGENSDA